MTKDNSLAYHPGLVLPDTDKNGYAHDPPMAW